MLESHGQVLKEISLYQAIQNVQYGLSQSPYHLFCLLEMFNSKTGTFFTSVGGLGLALHEMYKVSALFMGEVSYEEYTSTTEELNMLRVKDEHIYETYLKMMYHYHIYADLAGTRSQGINHKKWVTY